MILNDIQIEELAIHKQMIDPFVDHQVSHDGISYGLSSFGYDARLADDFRVFRNPMHRQLLDPKSFVSDVFDSVQGNGSCIIPPNSFILGRTVEYFKLPRNVLAICLGKSTYARCGLIVNVTPLEPEWEGTVTIEISNTTPHPAIVYANEGIAQFLFLGGYQPRISYQDRKGKYQGQVEVTMARGALDR